MADRLSYVGGHHGDDRYTVTPSPRGINGLDVHNNPLRQINRAAKLDFLRLIEDDGTWQVIHLTHNEVIKGESRFSGSMLGWIPSVVDEFFEML